MLSACNRPRGKLDQILLQGRETEGVSHFEVTEPTVGSIGTDNELAIALEERGSCIDISEFRVREIAQYVLTFATCIASA